MPLPGRTASCDGTIGDGGMPGGRFIGGVLAAPSRVEPARAARSSVRTPPGGRAACGVWASGGGEADEAAGLGGVTSAIAKNRSR